MSDPGIVNALYVHQKTIKSEYQVSHSNEKDWTRSHPRFPILSECPNAVSYEKRLTYLSDPMLKAGEKSYRRSPRQACPGTKQGNSDSLPQRCRLQN